MSLRNQQLNISPTHCCENLSSFPQCSLTRFLCDHSVTSLRPLSLNSSRIIAFALSFPRPLPCNESTTSNLPVFNPHTDLFFPSQLFSPASLCVRPDATSCHNLSPSLLSMFKAGFKIVKSPDIAQANADCLNEESKPSVL